MFGAVSVTPIILPRHTWGNQVCGKRTSSSRAHVGEQIHRSTSQVRLSSSVDMGSRSAGGPSVDGPICSRDADSERGPRFRRQGLLPVWDERAASLKRCVHTLSRFDSNCRFWPAGDCGSIQALRTRGEKAGRYVSGETMPSRLLAAE